MRKKVFICSPFRGDMEGNARKAAAYCRMACEQGFLPVAPHLLFPQFLNEGIGDYFAPADPERNIVPLH